MKHRGTRKLGRQLALGGPVCQQRALPRSPSRGSLESRRRHPCRPRDVKFQTTRGRALESKAGAGGAGSLLSTGSSHTGEMGEEGPRLSAVSLVGSNVGSTPGITYSPRSLPGGIPEHRARSQLRALLGVSPNQKAGKKSPMSRSSSGSW